MAEAALVPYSILAHASSGFPVRNTAKTKTINPKLKVQFFRFLLPVHTVTMWYDNTLSCFLEFTLVIHNDDKILPMGSQRTKTVLTVERKKHHLVFSES